MRKALAGLSVAVVATGFGHGVVSRAGASSPWTTFTVVQTPGRLVDEATHAAPDFTKPIPPGDTLVFKNDLTQQHRVVGHSRGSCTAVFDTTLLCNATFDIDGQGSLEVQAVFDVANPVGDYAVIGGTGAFAGRHGWGHFVAQPSGEETHTFHLDG